MLFSPDSKGFVKNIRFEFVCEQEPALGSALSREDDREAFQGVSSCSEGSGLAG
jgi:hypothetical protein